MQKSKHTPESINHQPELRVVSQQQNQAHVAFEIDRHVKSIQALIGKLSPPERQRYYNGFLNHLLAEPVPYPHQATSMTQPKMRDYSTLSANEVQLIRELSSQMELLYRTIGSDPE